MIFKLCRVCANLLNFKVLLLPKHSQLDALLLQLLSHGLREACRIVLGNLQMVKMRTSVECPEGLSDTQQLERFLSASLPIPCQTSHVRQHTNEKAFFTA